MAENDDPTPGSDDATSAPAEETVEQTTVTSQAAPATTTKFTDRVWNFRAMVAVALAALLLGGGAGAAIAAVSHNDRHDRYPGFMRWEGGPGGPMMGPGMNGFGPGDRKQLRQDLRDMRQRMRQQLKQDLQDGKPTPVPPTPTTPSPSPNG